MTFRSVAMCRCDGLTLTGWWTLLRSLLVCLCVMVVLILGRTMVNLLFLSWVIALTLCIVSSSWRVIAVSIRLLLGGLIVLPIRPKLLRLKSSIVMGLFVVLVAINVRASWLRIRSSPGSFAIGLNSVRRLVASLVTPWVAVLIRRTMMRLLLVRGVVVVLIYRGWLLDLSTLNLLC